MSKNLEKNVFLLSIIIVCYNSENYIEEAINSVINQSLNDWELIIIDGKSTDKTIKIIKRYMKYISFFVSENDDGIYDAMNKGLFKSKGSHISFLNSDDLFLPNYVKNIKNAVTQNDAPFFVSPVNIVNKNNCKIGLYYPVNNHAKNILFKCSPFPHLGVSIKSSLLKDLNGFNTNFKFCSDYELMIRLVRKFGYSYQCIPYINANYREGGRSSKLPSNLETFKLLFIEGTFYFAIKYILRLFLIKFIILILNEKLLIKFRRRFGRKLNYRA